MAKPAHASPVSAVPSAPGPKTAAKDAPAEAVKPPRKSRKLLMIIAALLVLSAGGGGGAWWYFNRAHDATPKPALVKAPLFHALEPFTVNLLEENGDHFLQTSVVLQIEDDKAVDQIKTYLPVIRSRMLLLLSAKHPSELTTPQGKKQLVDELVAAARESLPGPTPERGVRSAFLGAFVIQ